MSITPSKKANIRKILGIDFGKTKIGLAVADSETRIAFGYEMLKNDKKLPEKIVEIIKKEGISKIIIGFAGTKSQELATLLERETKLPTEFQNEIFSTQQAERNLKEKGAKKIKRLDDQEAARIILQSWLDK